MSATPHTRAQALRTVTEHDVPVPLRDGTVLNAVVSRPDVDHPVPVVLMRSPYPLEGTRMDVDPWAVLRRGLALVRVSHRGTGESGGDFEPWADDADDGADVLAWCADQPWSTGDVVTHGRSYLAQTQLFAAGRRPPALRAMGLGVVPGDAYDVVHQGGAVLLGSGLGWAVFQAGARLSRAVARGEGDPADLAEWDAVVRGLDRIMAQGPVDIPVLERGLPGWRSWLGRPARDAWWAERAVPDRDPVPGFFVGGWHDIFVRGTLSEFERSRHPLSRLVVGPWGHGPGGSALGEVVYGFGASAPAIGLDEEMLDFLAAHAHGRADALGAADAPVRLHLMGADEWVSTTAWPPPESVERSWHLHPGGRLASGPPAPGAEPVTFVHDPAHPVPTVGGANLFTHGDAAGGTGQWDQRVKDGRDDVVSFVSEPLTEAVDVVGEVRLELVASTTAVDADWCATLVDVHPDGRAFNVVDGVIRARFAETDTREQLLPAGVPHRLVVRVGPTAQRFAAGHRIRVDVAGSNHPRFDVNPGNGGTWAATPRDEYVVGHQTLHLDAAEPLRLVLPVLPPRTPEN